MPRRPDEFDLLRLIEDDLDPARDVADHAAHVAELQRAVAADPSLAVAIAQARAHRDELRRLPQPVPPRDFVAGLELFLAPSAPNVRLPRRPSALAQGFARSWSRLALAAAIGAAATGGVWVASMLFDGWRGASDGADRSTLAAAGDAQSGTSRDIGAAQPRRGAPDTAAPGSLAVAPPGSVHGADDGTTTPRSIVAMVIESNDPRLVEAALRRLVAERVGDKGALVRNFTTDEALALASRMGRAIDDEHLRELAARGTPDAPALADGSNPGAGAAGGAPRPAPGVGSPLSREAAASQRAMLEQALAAVKRDRGPARAATADAVRVGDLPPALGRDRTLDAAGAHQAGDALGALLAGSHDAAPSPESQLAFGDGEFTLTLSVPAELLSPLLVEMAYEAAIRGVLLQPLDAGERPSPIDASRWRRWHEAAVDAAASGRIAVPIRIVPANK